MSGCLFVNQTPSNFGEIESRGGKIAPAESGTRVHDGRTHRQFRKSFALGETPGRKPIPAGCVALQRVQDRFIGRVVSIAPKSGGCHA